MAGILSLALPLVHMPSSFHVYQSGCRISDDILGAHKVNGNGNGNATFIDCSVLVHILTPTNGPFNFGISFLGVFQAKWSAWLDKSETSGGAIKKDFLTNPDYGLMPDLLVEDFLASILCCSQFSCIGLHFAHLKQ